MRSRGTRVCNLCSRFLTRARISETICTPLLFDAVPDDEELAFVGRRDASVGRGVVVGIPVDSREVVKLERVWDRVIVAVLSLDAGEFAHDGGSPARFISAACPIEESVDEPDDTFLELAKFVDDSDDDRENCLAACSSIGDRSESCKSDGGFSARMFSLEGISGLKDAVPDVEESYVDDLFCDFANARA